LSDERPHITIYTDGGAHPNPGPGGWAAILLHPRKTRKLSGSDLDTTNNRMELTAAIEALKVLKVPCVIEFYTDSEYLKKGIEVWIHNWIRTGRLQRGDVKNADLWQQLHDLRQPHEIHWHWVRGHAGTEYNERAHQLATEARQRRLKA
jgi:ribonuclease HI